MNRIAAEAEEKPEGAPEWMVSFADMITIMMSFFVIMFALASGKNEKKQEAVRQSIEQRFGPAWRPFANWGAGLLPRDTRFKIEPGPAEGKPATVPNEVAQSSTPNKDISRIRIPGRGDRVVLGGEVYFDETSAELTGAEKARLKAIVEDLAGKPQKIEVLGHASKRPLPPGSPYRDHWDLAYARCRRTVESLASLGIDSKRIRMGVAGSNELAHLGTDPVLAKENSRVDIYLLDALADELEGTPEEKAKQRAPRGLN
ncbi:MAG: OmpA/MotB family protein [Pirellulales bacterium]